MQEYRQSSSQNLQQYSAKDDLPSRSYTGRGDRSASRSNSGSQKDFSVHQEALLKAQLFELRRDLAESQQKAQSAQQDLQKRQSLIKAAAGEARKEVLSLRAENQDIRGQLTAAQERIQELEVELELVKGKLLEVADESEGVAIKGLKDRLAKAEEELEDLRANDRVHTATKAALHAQVEALVDEISRTREQLADSTHEKANNTDSDHPGGTADLEDELQELRGDYNQALTQIETLQNELNVALQEASQDRLSAAAKILRLEGQESLTCQRVCPPDVESSAGDIDSHLHTQPLEGLKGLLSPSAQRKGSPVRSFDRQHLLKDLTAEDGLEYGQPGSRIRPAGRPPGELTEKRLVAELRAASSYLQDFSTRFQDSSVSLRSLESSEGGGGIHQDIAVFKQALESLEARLNPDVKPSLSGGSAVSVDSREEGPLTQELQSKQQNLVVKLAGGLLLAPALAALALFVPARSK